MNGQVIRRTRSVRAIILYRLKDGNLYPGKKPAFKKAGRSGRRNIIRNIGRQYRANAKDRYAWAWSKDHNLDSVQFARRDDGNLKRFINGHSTAFNEWNQWFTLASFPLDTGSHTVFRARIRIPHQPDLYIYNDTLPGKAFASLPVFDPEPCQPLNRFFDFKRLKGFGYQNIKPLRYIPSGRQIFHKKFEIIFERNSTIVNPEQLQPVIRFLKDNRYSILNASVEGYASVEGPEENNYRLQQKRAELMINILQQNNDDEIILDTVIAKENWDMFFEQVAQSPFRSLDSLAQDSIRILLRDSLWLTRLDTVLGAERKAILNLTLANIFTPAEINENILRDMRRLSYFIFSLFQDIITG